MANQDAATIEYWKRWNSQVHPDWALAVGNLSPYVTKDDLFKKFSFLGISPLECNISFNLLPNGVIDNSKPKPSKTKSALIIYKDGESTLAAFRRLHGSILLGKQLSIELMSPSTKLYPIDPGFESDESAGESAGESTGESPDDNKVNQSDKPIRENTASNKVDNKESFKENGTTYDNNNNNNNNKNENGNENENEKDNEIRVTVSIGKNKISKNGYKDLTCLLYLFNKLGKIDTNSINYIDDRLEGVITFENLKYGNFKKAEIFCNELDKTYAKKNGFDQLDFAKDLRKDFGQEKNENKDKNDNKNHINDNDNDNNKNENESGVEKKNKKKRRSKRKKN